MSPQLVKEVRLLFPAWLAAVVLVALPFGWVSSMTGWGQGRFGSSYLEIGDDFGLLAKGAVFVLGILLLAVSVFGREIAGGTWQLFLTQPVSRAAIWNRKLAVFGFATALVWLVFWLSFGSEDGLSWRIGLGSFAVAAAVGTTGLVATLFFRQVLPAFAFSLLLPSLLGPIVWSMAEKGFPAWIFIDALFAVGIYTLVALRLSQLLLFRAEDLGPWLENLPVSFPQRSVQTVEASAGRPRVLGRSGRSILFKEARLQQMNLICGLVLLPVIFVIELFLRGAERSEMGDGLRTAYSLVLLLLPVLAGAVAIAEERKLGLLAGQRVLPVSAARQFLTKLTVVGGSALLLGLALPLMVAAVVSILGGFTAESGGMEPMGLAYIMGFRLGDVENRILFFTAYALVTGAVSLYASSFSRSTLGALVVAVVFLALGGLVTMVVQEFWTGGHLWTIVAMASAVLVCAALAFWNFQKDVWDARAWRWNVAAIAGSGAVALLLTAFTHYRAWEVYLTNLTEPVLAEAEPMLEEGAEIFPVAGRWLVHLPDGRLWVSEQPWATAEAFSFPAHGEFLEEDDWVEVAASSYAVAGIRSDGGLWRIAAGDEGRSTVRVEVLAEGRWTDIAAGESHRLAVRDDGTMWGWGSSRGFQLEYSRPTTTISKPQQIGNETDWVEAHATDRGSLGGKDDGSMLIWGGGRGSPRRIEFVGSNVKGVGGDSFVSVAIATDGSLWRWGGRWLYDAPPQRMGDRNDWKDADASWEEAIVALDQEGALWGANLWRSPDDWADEWVPSEKMSEHSRWVAVTADDQNIFALADDGSFWNWEMPEWFRKDRPPPLLGPSRRPRRVGE